MEETADVLRSSPAKKHPSGTDVRRQWAAAGACGRGRVTQRGGH